ncbi:MAG: pyruvate kinase, partial [Thiovulaceae bacterium]|nr:pyruvate kinase [Sulfurimonadaceae bacterium]
AVIKRIRQASKNTGLFVGILQDISGPKVRVGKLEENFLLKKGDILEFVPGEIMGRKVSDGHYQLSINQSEILSKIKEGEFIYLYDGSIRAKVESVGEKVLAVIQNSGKLSSNKGVNFPNTRIGIDVLTPKDRQDMLWGIEHEVDFMAISFVQNGSDMQNARKIVQENGGHQQLFAKIEKFDAVENIDEILEASDGIMVARGDLGIEVPYYEVPVIQKRVIQKANAASKPVITATQMLLSMTENEMATRAEISDVANAVLDGTDAVMLSEESAIGQNPVLTVETMVHTIRETEKIYAYNKFAQFAVQDEMDVIDESAVMLASKLSANAILAFTTSGQSAKKLARYRPEKTILAIIHDERVARSLTIVWGVAPAFMVRKSNLQQMLSDVIKKGLKDKVLKKEGCYVMTAGDPVGVPGTTNNIRILRRPEMNYFNDL